MLCHRQSQRNREEHPDVVTQELRYLPKTTQPANSSALFPLPQKIKSTIGQWHPVGSKHSGLSLRQRCPGSCWTGPGSHQQPWANVPQASCPLWTAVPYWVSKLLPNRTWVYCSPVHSKANLLTPVCGEGKCSVYCKAPDKESWTTSAQKAWTPQWVSAKHF